MAAFDFTVSCPVHDSFRVQQVAGMFDVPLAEKATERFAVELPTDADDWQIGLIVGPSGSGKSTVAKRVFGDALYRGGEVEASDDCGLAIADCGLKGINPQSEIRNPKSIPSPWPADRAVVDCFGDLPVRRVVELFTAVGFGSPPSWVKPYPVLSCGERFRCDLARARGRVESLGSRVQGQKAPLALDPRLSTLDFRWSCSTNSPAWSTGPSPNAARPRLPRGFAAGTCRAGSWRSRVTTTLPSGSSPIGCSTWRRGNYTGEVRRRRSEVRVEVRGQVPRPLTSGL